MHVLLVVGDGVEKHFLLFAALTYGQDVLQGFKLLTARPGAEHKNTTLWTENRHRSGLIGSL